jgi:hypothetical protein
VNDFNFGCRAKLNPLNNLQNISNKFLRLLCWETTSSQIHSMKSKTKTKFPALAMSPLMLASVFAKSIYQYSLQGPQDFGSAFVDSVGLANWQGVDGGPVLPAGSSFSINSTKGL